METRARTRIDWVSLNPQPLPPKAVIVFKPIPFPEPDPYPFRRFGSVRKFY